MLFGILDDDKLTTITAAQMDVLPAESSKSRRPHILLNAGPQSQPHDGYVGDTLSGCLARNILGSKLIGEA